MECVGVEIATARATTRLRGACTLAARWLARSDVRAALLATLGLRVLCSLVAIAAPLLLPDLYPWAAHRVAGTGGFQGPYYPAGLPRPVYSPLDYLIQPWNRWDTPWYVEIAQHGYATFGTTAFLPLYPLLMRLTAPLVGGDLIAAGIVVSTVTAFLFLLALYRLAERLAPGTGAAPYALLVAVMLPTSFFFMAAYTESLFLALTLWAIVAALDGHWGRVAVLGGLAALTRQQGVLVVLLALPGVWSWLVWLVHDLRRRAAGRSAQGSPLTPLVLVAAVAPLATYGAYILFVQFVLRAPSPWELLVDRNAWNLHFTWPWTGLVADLTAILGLSHGVTYVVWSTTCDLLTTLGVLIVLPLAARRWPPALAPYLGAILVTSLVKVLPTDLTVSAGRYVLQMLPLCIVPAAWLARGGPPRRLAWVAIAVPCLALYVFIFSLGGWVA